MTDGVYRQAKAVCNMTSPYSFNELMIYYMWSIQALMAATSDVLLNDGWKEILNRPLTKQIHENYVFVFFLREYHNSEPKKFSFYGLLMHSLFQGF